ncbi:hypothetical protein BDR26DRAFT_870849 [Obelidium mucronatum]|nr:hypothetical protein BDR26DRAFT_870849 [Obelidium mucronatum]
MALLAGPDESLKPTVTPISQIHTYGPPSSLSTISTIPCLFSSQAALLQLDKNDATPSQQQQQVRFQEPSHLHMPSIDPSPSILRNKCHRRHSIAFGAIKNERVTTLIPFLSTKSNLIHTTDTIHNRGATRIGSLSPEQVKLRNSQYHFLAPRNVPTLHRHPVGIRPDPSSDFVPREKYAGQKETWAYDSSEVGAPARLAVWVDRARNGGLFPSQVAEAQITPRNAQEKNVEEWGGMGVGLGDPRIFENQFRMDKRISLLISSHRWNGGGDVRLSSNGTLIYKIHRKSVGTKQTLILCDTAGRKVWKLSERIGFTGFNYDFYRYILADSNNKNTSNNNTNNSNTPNNNTTTNTNKPTPKPITTKWYLIGTLDRTCPESSTGQANTIYGSLSNKCIANKQPPTMNLRHDNFCGRVGAGGVVGIASPTGCVGDSMIMPFTRLLMKWNGWGTHVVQAAVSNCNGQQRKQQQHHHLHQYHQQGQYSTQNPQSLASLNKNGDNADVAIVVGGEDGSWIKKHHGMRERL